MIGRNGERGSGISALAARHDDDDDDDDDMLYQCWLSLNHFVGLWRTKCNIIWRVLNICDRAII